MKKPGSSGPAINACIRTPSEIIGLAIEDADIPAPGSRAIADDAAARLARSMERLSRPGARVIIVAEGGELGWATFHGTEEES